MLSIHTVFVLYCAALTRSEDYCRVYLGMKSRDMRSPSEMRSPPSLQNDFIINER